MGFIKRCRCKMCQRGLRTKYGDCIMRQAHRRMRQKTKLAIKKDEEPPIHISIVYTD